MNLALYVFVFCFNEASSSVTSFLRFFSQLSVMGTYIRPSIKKILFAVPTQIFQVGRKEGQYACCVFLYDYCCWLLFVS